MSPVHRGTFFRPSSDPINLTTQSSSRIRELIDIGFSFVPSQLREGGGWIPAPPGVESTPPLIGGGPGGGVTAALARWAIELAMSRWRPGGGATGIQDEIDPWLGPDPLAPVPGGGDMPFLLPRGAVPFISMPNGMPGCPSGYHPHKGDRPYCVRNRRMNSCNMRALSRASRRVGGFARAVKRAKTLKKIVRAL